MVSNVVVDLPESGGLVSRPVVSGTSKPAAPAQTWRRAAVVFSAVIVLGVSLGVGLGVGLKSSTAAPSPVASPPPPSPPPPSPSPPSPSPPPPSPPSPPSPPPPSPPLAYPSLITFTSCGVTGRLAPTLAQCTAAYSAYAWSNDSSIFTLGMPAGAIDSTSAARTDLWQSLVLPQAATYNITAAGAFGSRKSNNVLLCRGAVVSLVINLPARTVLFFMVGQHGAGANDPDPTGTAGGGTFVLLANGTALVVAGGGGGCSFSGGALPPTDRSCDASITSSDGQRSQDNMPGGTAGRGGSSTGGGAGLSGDGGDLVAMSAMRGGDSAGGSFPGGGRAGGGSGYSGGGGSDPALAPTPGWGGGGGSYCIAGLSNCATGYNARPSSSYTGTNAGYVTIQQLPWGWQR